MVFVVKNMRNYGIQIIYAIIPHVFNNKFLMFFLIGIIDNIANSESFQFQIKITGKASDNDNKKMLKQHCH